MSDPHGQLRVGNAERSAAVAELQQAAVDGKLTPDELTERSALAQAARTYADLDALLGDLRPPAPPVQLQPVQSYPVTGYRGSSDPTAPPGWSPHDPLLINAGFTGAKRTGPWEVPPFLQVQALADLHRGHEAREVFRLLRPGGMFAFSSANGRNLPPRPWTVTAIRNMGIRPSLKGLIYGMIQWSAGLIHFLKLRTHEASHADYSIRVDQAHNFKLLRCLVNPAQQKRQLLRAGFADVTAIDREGQQQNPDDPAFVSCPVCYICQKPTS